MIDSTLWVDYFRPKTPLKVKEQVVAFIDDPRAILCEPVRFEILHAALKSERRAIEEIFDTFPMVESPLELWTDAVALGQKCSDSGIHPTAMDLLIAQVCLSEDHELVCFDKHFAEIGKVCALNVRLLTRAV